MWEDQGKISTIDELPVVLTVPQLAGFLQISRTKAYELTYRKGFPAVRMGKTVRVPREAFLRWLNQTSGEHLP
jgi:excisionase family DNA binding protein